MSDLTAGNYRVAIGSWPNLSQLFQATRNYITYQRELRKLHNLPDHLLRDIGTHRGELQSRFDVAGEQMKASRLENPAMGHRSVFEHWHV